jgi:hypothetical protein
MSSRHAVDRATLLHDEPGPEARSESYVVILEPLPARLHGEPQVRRYVWLV